MVFSDFDEATITFKLEADNTFSVKLEWGCLKTLLDNGSKEVLEEVYKGLGLDIGETTVTVSVKPENIPSDEKQRGLN